jgi:hypothetical protein
MSLGRAMRIHRWTDSAGQWTGVRSRYCPTQVPVQPGSLTSHRALESISWKQDLADGAEISPKAAGDVMPGLHWKEPRYELVSGANNLAQRDAAVSEASGAAQAVEEFGSG